MSTRSIFCTLVLLGLLSAAVTGCGGEEGPLANKPFVGTWIEVVKENVAQVQSVQTDPDRVFRLEIQPDNTFSWTVLNAEGEPHDPPQEASGSWHIHKGRAVEFEVEQNTIGDEVLRDSDVPWRTITMYFKEAGAEKDQIDIRLTSGTRINMVPAEQK